MRSTTKNTKIFYWVSTGILAAFILPGAFYIGSKMALEGTAHLGLPVWFHYELSIAKVIGALVLIVPFFSKRIKEWAYVGLAIDFISATIAQLSVDGLSSMWYLPLIFVGILVVSYVSYHQLQDRRADS